MRPISPTVTLAAQRAFRFWAFRSERVKYSALSSLTFQYLLLHLSSAVFLIVPLLPLLISVYLYHIHEHPFRYPLGYRLYVCLSLSVHLTLVLTLSHFYISSFGYKLISLQYSSIILFPPFVFDILTRFLFDFFQYYMHGKIMDCLNTVLIFECHIYMFSILFVDNLKLFHLTGPGITMYTAWSRQNGDVILTKLFLTR